MAPEWFGSKEEQNAAHHSTSADIWSLGCVLYECAMASQTPTEGSGGDLKVLGQLCRDAESGAFREALRRLRKRLSGGDPVMAPASAADITAGNALWQCAEQMLRVMPTERAGAAELRTVLPPDAAGLSGRMRRQLGSLLADVRSRSPRTSPGRSPNQSAQLSPPGRTPGAGGAPGDGAAWSRAAPLAAAREETEAQAGWPLKRDVAARRRARSPSPGPAPSRPAAAAPPPANELLVEKPLGGGLGADLDRCSLAVVNVIDGGPMADAGGAAFLGRRVTHVNGTEVSTPADVARLVAPVGAANIAFAPAPVPNAGDSVARSPPPSIGVSLSIPAGAFRGRGLRSADTALMFARQPTPPRSGDGAQVRRFYSPHGDE